MHYNFNAIPQELRDCPYWCLWKYEDIGARKPTKVPYSAKTSRSLDVNKVQDFASFEEAFNIYSLGGYSGLGFVFHENHSYSFIDLDDTEGDEAAFERQLRIFKSFDSYSELSPSGKGLHIIVKGKVPTGRRRAHVEMYSTMRYATMTGNVHADKSIAERQELLTQLWTELGGSVNNITYTGDDKEPAPDNEIITRALNAVNGDKFEKLLNGEWQSYYSSQSEADIAFIDIVAFYTQNRNQIARIFRASPLGQRDKAKRVDYVDRMILKSFDKMSPPIDIYGMQNALEEIKGRVAQRLEPVAHNGSVVGSNPTTSTNLINLAGSSIGKASGFEPDKVGSIPAPASTISLPPGLVGELAQFIYNAAPRPVPEIALAGALGLMAGICGKAYNVSNTGLNQYILLLAKTGMGKEGMAAGIDKLMNAVKLQVPTANEFIGPSHISSGQALVKYVHKNHCFVSILGEFGLRIQNMSSLNASSHDRMLKQILLELYNKSGATDVYRASIYADFEKNSEATQGPAFSILGESVPSSFYNALSEEMISEGLLPRFLIIEYNGQRPDLNKAAATTYPPIPLVDMLVTLCANCKQLAHNNKTINVQLDDEAGALSDKFDNFATRKINQTTNEVVLNLWNRAHLKALKLSALIAVGVNPYQPIITKEYLEWSIDIVQKDIMQLTIKFETGEVGMNTGENKQQDRIVQIIKEFIDKPFEEVAKYVTGGINPATRQMMHSSRVVPYSYISRKLIADAQFKNDKLGATNAIKRNIQLLVDNDRMREVPKHEMQSKFGSTQRAFMISDMGIIS